MAVRLGIVVPCYNEQEVLDETARRLAALLDRLCSAGLIDRASAVYFVDDGSRDDTWPIIQRLSSDPRFRGIKLSRNRGHQNALFAGLMNAEGDALISVDADLQDDLEVIEQMVRRFIDGIDIVYGVRSDRTTDTWFKRFTAESYYRVLSALGVQVVFNHADYRLLSRRALVALASYREVNLFLRGIIPQLGFRTATVEYARGERFAGESKYPLKKMVALALEGVTSFTAAPLRAITGLGFLVCLGSFGMVAWALLARLFTDAAMPGWASTVVPMYFLGGVQLLCLGVIGEYLAKIYTEVKARPRYLIDAVAGPAQQSSTDTLLAPPAQPVTLGARQSLPSTLVID
jgi:glycosyltransferase involved in cell wall biosynthesis